MRLRPVVAALLVGTALLGALHPGGKADAAPPARVVFVAGSPCSEDNFVCHGFARALRVTGVDGRIHVRDFREDPAASLSLLARQGYRLVIMDWWSEEVAGTVARRFPEVTFVLLDVPSRRPDARVSNLRRVAIRTHEASFLAGWLAARLEARRPGRDVIGVVAGDPVQPVEDFVVGFRAGARRASRGVDVLVGYSNDFADPSKCEAVARRQIARGAGVLFNVAGSCGLGTLEAAKDAGVWGIGVDVDQSFLGRHVLTSVVKRYEVVFASFLRSVGAGRAGPGRNAVFGLAQRAAELGRISPKVPRPLLAELETVRRRIVAGEIRVPGAAP